MGEVSAVRGEGRKKEALKCITHITGCRCPLKATSQPCAPCHSNPEEGLPPPVPCNHRGNMLPAHLIPLPIPSPCILGKAGR